MRDLEDTGWSVLTGGGRRRGCRRGGVRKLDVADALGRPRSNERYWEMRQEVVSLGARSGRQGVVILGRNRHRTSSEQRVLGEEIGEVWGRASAGCQRGNVEEAWAFKPA